MKVCTYINIIDVTNNNSSVFVRVSLCSSSFRLGLSQRIKILVAHYVKIKV